MGEIAWPIAQRHANIPLLASEEATLSGKEEGQVMARDGHIASTAFFLFFVFVFPPYTMRKPESSGEEVIG